MPVKLFDHQQRAVDELGSGKILCGTVGSGKSITSLYYYFVKECKGEIIDNVPHAMKEPKDLYIITTARKRDSGEWGKECTRFRICSDREASIGGVQVIVDSWNNINKYTDVSNAFFIFDEQRLVGYGAWVKSFFKIVKRNRWILLSGTPGDRWSDYIPVFIANGFYRNKTEFESRHIIYNPHTTYPQILRYIDCSRLCCFRDKILVYMDYVRSVTKKEIVYKVGYNREKYDVVCNDLWNIFEDRPVENKSQYCQLLRRIANIDQSRLLAINTILCEHKKIILFYSFNYELEILKAWLEDQEILYAEWNGSRHEEIPSEGDCWVYLVQYTAGAEGWNCIETDTIVFYSLQYSYRIKVQAMGRIDRINTPYNTLYYYSLISNSSIDSAIQKANKQQRDFNENGFAHSRLAS